MEKKVRERERDRERSIKRTERTITNTKKEKKRTSGATSEVHCHHWKQCKKYCNNQYIYIPHFFFLHTSAFHNLDQYYKNYPTWTMTYIHLWPESATGGRMEWIRYVLYIYISISIYRYIIIWKELFQSIEGGMKSMSLQNVDLYFLKRFSFYSKISLSSFILSPVLYWNDPRVILVPKVSSHFSPFPISLTHPNVFQENDLKVYFRKEDRFEGVIRRDKNSIYL